MSVPRRTDINSQSAMAFTVNATPPSCNLMFTSGCRLCHHEHIKMALYLENLLPVNQLPLYHGFGTTRVQQNIACYLPLSLL